jgi:hypothetical protein
MHVRTLGRNTLTGASCAVGGARRFGALDRRGRPLGAAGLRGGHLVEVTAPVQRDGVSVLRHQVPVDRMPQSPVSRCCRIVASRLAELGPPGTEGRGFLPSLAPIEEVSQCA